jgi:hypothetical protein
MARKKRRGSKAKSKTRGRGKPAVLSIRPKKRGVKAANISKKSKTGKRKVTTKSRVRGRKY